MSKLNIPKEYLSTLYLLANKKVLFVSSYEGTCSQFIMRRAMSCNQEFVTLSRWVSGTLSNPRWVSHWNDTQTISSLNVDTVDFILCFSDSKEVLDEVYGLGIPVLYFVHDNPKDAMVSASYCSFIIKKLQTRASN